MEVIFHNHFHPKKKKTKNQNHYLFACGRGI